MRAPKSAQQTFVTLRRFASTINRLVVEATGLQVPRQSTLNSAAWGRKLDISRASIVPACLIHIRFADASQPRLGNHPPPPPAPTRENLVAGRFPGALHFKSVNESIVRIRGECGAKPVT